jgi:hypothetical protein
MKSLIACCGLDCAVCDAQVATVTNDNALRAKTAAKWKNEYNIPNITLEMINCTGCREPGAKIGHCAECEIRNCSASKHYQTCAECSIFEKCSKLEKIFKFNPATLNNLQALRS